MKEKITNYLIVITLIAAMGGLLFGYDWVVIGGAKIYYEQFFGIIDAPLLRGWAMSSALVGCLIGAVMAGIMSDRCGRKLMLIIASALFVVSAIGTGAVNSFTWFIFYRIVGGLGIGIASQVSPIYIAEVSPASVRGRFVALNQLTIVLGILAAQIVNWLIGKSYARELVALSSESISEAWRWMFWMELIPAGIFFILSFIIPESPRWLVINSRVEKARIIFSKINGDTFDSNLFLQEIDKKIGKELIKWSVLLRKDVRGVLIIGIVLAVFQQWCGINVIFNYAHEIFSSAGYAVSDVLMNIVITGITNLLFTFVAIYTVDKWGRRALMLIGSAGLALIYTVMGTFYFFGVTGFPMLMLVMLAIACYAMSLAPVVWVVLSEIFPAHVRGVAVSVATFFLWSACFVLTYTFPILNNIFGASGTFWIYAVICLMGFIFIRYNLPETKGRSLEELERELTQSR